MEIGDHKPGLNIHSHRQPAKLPDSIPSQHLSVDQSIREFGRGGGQAFSTWITRSAASSPIA